MSHAQVATEIMEAIDMGAEVAPVRVTRSARQGDLTLVRMSDADNAEHAPTPEGGIVLAEGSHGEHRLCAPLYRLVENRLSIPEGGTVVHTDQPNARHRACALVPGTWRVGGLKELSPDEIVERKVVD